MTLLNDPFKFVHLRAHTEYSISDGLLRIQHYIKRAIELNMPAVAITDQMNLFGLVKFYSKAISQGLKPIVGVDLILDEGNDQFSFTLLCQNQIGYHHLTRLISRAYLTGQKENKPTVKWSWLEEANQGLIAISGAKAGDVGQALLSDQQQLAKKRLQRWLQYFPNRYYLELQRTGRDQEEDYLHMAIDLARQFQVPVVATNDVRFLHREDFEAHEARVCIHCGYVLDDMSRPRIYSEEQYLKSPEEMAELFSDIPEALINTVEIAKRCNLQLELGKVFLPNFPLPQGILLEDYFEKQAKQGLEQRLARVDTQAKAPLLRSIQTGEQWALYSAGTAANSAELESKKENYLSRLELELSVINTMGFAGYFLIVADFINWAKQQNIPVGPGRGSGAGSLVAYALGITELDPIEHELLFERFLNPERISMPDFDIDFCMEGRDRVIDYVTQRYGREAVSQIITYGTMAAKAVVRDAGRVLGMPYGFVDKIAKLIPFELGMTLEKALQQEPQLTERYKKEEEVATLIDLAKKLEGITRNAGKHAGGVVIAPTRLTDFTPLYCEPGGDHPVTQFDKDDVEAVGLVKFDFLGLRTLTIIHKALLTINARRRARGEEAIDILQIPLDDKKTFDLLKSCATTAVFQLESRGMKDLVRRLEPDSFNEIVALVALFRPGPLQSGMVDDFINRKHGRQSADYLHPDLESILRPTYGVILYQEQVMQIAQVLAGYSLGGADILRRAMGKKKPQEMARQRLFFIEGASKRGVDAHISAHIFDLMEKFAGYGFNKSHSAAYALISYQTAWLKAHYPAEFMAAVLSSDMDNTDKVVSFLSECKNMKIEILAPNINISDYPFTVNEKGQIEYGLGAIKGVGEAAALHIVSERNSNGVYKDLFQFCERLDNHKINRRVMEPLIRSGAMDCFGIHRGSLFASIEKAFQMAEQKNKNKAIGQGDLFADLFDSEEESSSENYIHVHPWDEQMLLRSEKAVLGWYLSGHPLQLFDNELSQLTQTTIGNLANYRQKTTTIGGMVTGIRVVTTRMGKRLAIVQLEDTSGKIDVTVFGELYEPIRDFLTADQIVIIKGKVDKDEFTGGVKMVAESIEILEQARIRLAKKLWIEIENQDQMERLMSELPDVIKPFCGGNCPITISYRSQTTGASFQLGDAWRVFLKQDLLENLRQLSSIEKIVVDYGSTGV